MGEGSALAKPAPAAQASPTATAVGVKRDHDITIEDYFTITHPMQVTADPSGRHIAWVELRWQEDLPTRNSEVWVADRKAPGGVRPQRLTFHAAFDGEPHFFPDGRSLAFVSMRKDDGAPALAEGVRQVWRVGVDGSGMRALTAHKGGIESWHLSADGKALYYTTGREQQDDDGFAALRKSHALEYGRGVRKWSTLWRLDLEDWRLQELAKVHAFVGAFTVDRAQRRALLLTVPSRRLIDNEGWSKAELLELTPTMDADKPKLTPLPDALFRGEAPSPFGWLEHPVFSDDGKVAAFTVGFDGYPAEIIAFELEGAQPRGHRLPRFEAYSLDGELAFRPGSRELCARGTLRALDAVFCVAGIAGGKVGASTRLTPPEVGTIQAFSFAGSGELAAIVATTTSPPEVTVLGARGAKQRISRLNPQVDRWRLPQIQTIRWKSRDGTEVEGILELPPGYELGKGAPLPLVVELHGGPTSATKLELRYWIYGQTLFAARGWALLSPNYRGSTGYGDKFMTDLIGHENDRDVADILTGVDHLVALGVADPKRMAVMGWSNGGYLTNCVIVADQRFAAASSGAGVLDMAMQWMTEDTPGHVINYMRGQPWVVHDEMRRSSPLYGLEKVRTPTIIHFGAGDERVPVQHGQGLFRALDQYLKVPTQLVVYPGEGHGLGKRAHREAKLRWDVAWFERHVPGFGPKPAPGAATAPTQGTTNP